MPFSGRWITGIHTPSLFWSGGILIRGTFRKDCQEEEEESNAISQFDAQLRLLEGKLLQAKILASCGEDGELDASHAGSGGREEGQGTSFVAISGVSPEKEAKIELSCAVSFLDV